MALIACPECTREVSNSAPSCPNCGVAIAAALETKASGARLVTTQETSKKLKLHTMIAVLLIVIGVVGVVSASNQPTDSASSGSWPVLAISAGLVWYLVTRFRIWWHHK